MEEQRRAAFAEARTL